MFDNLRYDPKARQKILFFVFSGVLLISILSLLLWVNFGSNNSPADDTPIEQNANFQEDDSVVVTSKSFEDAADLELIDPEELTTPSQITHLPGDQIGVINSTFNLRINTQNIEGSPAFVPSKIFNTNDGIIINELSKSTVYQNNGQFTPLAQGITNLTPFNSDGKQVYLYLDSENTNGNYKIKQANSILLSANPPTISEFNPDKVYTIVEMEIFNQTPYLIGYSNYSKTGDVDIWQVTQNGTRKVKILDKVISTKSTGDNFIYTNELDIPNEITPYKTSVIDFSDPDNISENEVAVTTKLAQNSIFGNLLARRCNIDSENKLMCIVKQQKSSSDNPSIRDILVEIVDNNSISFPFPNLVFSSTDLHISPSNDIYFVSQSTGQLFRLKK